MRIGLRSSALTASVLRNTPNRNFCSSCRLRAIRSAPHATKLPPAKTFVKEKALAYPEHLLIWNAGVFKNALVGTVKLTPVLLFAWACLFAAPRYVILPEEPNWKAIVAVLLGAVPMICVSIASAPYVANIHIQLPKRARASRDALMRYCANLPENTPLEFTTVRMNGLQKTTVTTLGNLRPSRQRLGITNIERIVREEVQRKKSMWAKVSGWMKEPRNKLYVGGLEGERRSRAPGVWSAVWQHMQRKRP